MVSPFSALREFLFFVGFSVLLQGKANEKERVHAKNKI